MPFRSVAKSHPTSLSHLDPAARPAFGAFTPRLVRIRLLGSHLCCRGGTDVEFGARSSLVAWLLLPRVFHLDVLPCRLRWKLRITCGKSTTQWPSGFGVPGGPLQEGKCTANVQSPSPRRPGSPEKTEMGGKSSCHHPQGGGSSGNRIMIK